MIEILQVINGCTLISHLPNWEANPVHGRVWETNIAGTIKGAESRASMRAVPRRSVAFVVTAQTLEERVRLEARLDNALQTGFACAPLHGRGSTLMNATAAGSKANIILNLGGGWNWQAGDYAMLAYDDLNYDVAPVINVGLTADATTWTADSGLPIDQPALSLASPLNFNWLAGAIVRPVIFGKVTVAKQTPLNGALAQVKITIQEVVSGRSEQVGQLPAQRPGIGQQQIGHTKI